MQHTDEINAAIEFATSNNIGKFTEDHVALNHQILVPAAKAYLEQYTGDFSYLVSVQMNYKRYGLSASQAKGVLNCMMAEARREAAEAAKAAPVIEAPVVEAPVVEAPVVEAPAVQKVIDGTYTVILNGEDDYVTISIKTQKEGSKLAGKRVASFLAGPDNSNDYRGFAFVDETGPKVWRRFDPESRPAQALKVLLSMDAEKAAEAGYGYALKSGNCYICGRKLTVPTSLHRGLGPICAGRAA